MWETVPEETNCPLTLDFRRAVRLAQGTKIGALLRMRSVVAPCSGALLMLLLWVCGRSFSLSHPGEKDVCGQVYLQLVLQASAVSPVSYVA